MKNMRLITPNGDGTLIKKKDNNYRFPIFNDYFGSSVNIKNIKNLNSKNQYRLEKKYHDLSFKISLKITKEIIKLSFKNNIHSMIPIYLDTIRFFIEIFLTKLIRLKILNKKKDIRIYPRKNIYRFQTSESNNDLSKRFGYHNQNFQWAIFRIVLGCNDKIIISHLDSSYKKKIISKFEQLKFKFKTKIEQDFRGYYIKPTLKRLENLNELHIDFQDIPDLINRNCLKINDKEKRMKISNIFYNNLKNSIDHNLINANAIKKFSDLISRLLPNAIVEDVEKNFNNYKQYVSPKSKGYISIGGGLKDYLHANFFTSVCKYKEIPIITVQHSGLIGYEKSMPNFFTRDILLSDFYLSSGWKNIPAEFKKFNLKTKIIPLPNPYLSSLFMRGLKKRKKESGKVLIPLSKLLMLDEKLGGNSNDFSIKKLRTFVFQFLSNLPQGINEVVIIHRDDVFERDPLFKLLNSINVKITILSNKSVKPVDKFGEVDAVVWDVTSTGFIESLAFNIPTVALYEPSRWSSTYSSLSNLLKNNKILSANGKSAASNLNFFLKDKKRWKIALNKIDPFMKMHVSMNKNWKSDWNNFMRKNLDKMY